MEELHHALHVTAFLGAGEQFTVAERTGTSFAKTVVRLGIESLIAVEQRDIPFACTDFLTALVDNRFDTMLDERQSRKESCRSCTDDNGRMFGLMHVLKHRRFIEWDRGVLRNRLPLFVHQNSKMHAQLALPCIYTSFHYPPLPLSDIRFAWA